MTMDQTKPNPALRGPCIKCGSSERNYRGQCKSCKKASDAAYGAANREKINAGRNEWRKNNPREKEMANAWVQANREKVRQMSAKWRAAHPEKVKSNSANWRAANVDQARAIGATWRTTNAERHKAKNAKWWKDNPEKSRVFSHNRRARARANGGALSTGLAKKLYTLQRGKCACCRLPLGSDYQLDHILPLALGGPNTDDNIQLLRRRCNSQKHAKHPVAFMQSRGFLL